MRKIMVRRTSEPSSREAQQRLVTLLASGLERYLARAKRGAEVVDFVANESVTTTCAEAGDEGTGL